MIANITSPESFIRANTRLRSPSACPGRAYLPQQGLQQLARYTIPVTHDLESVTMRETILYKLVGF